MTFFSSIAGPAFHFYEIGKLRSSDWCEPEEGKGSTRKSPTSSSLFLIAVLVLLIYFEEVEITTHAGSPYIYNCTGSPFFYNRYIGSPGTHNSYIGSPGTHNSYIRSWDKLQVAFWEDLQEQTFWSDRIFLYKSSDLKSYNSFLLFLRCTTFIL